MREGHAVSRNNFTSEEQSSTSLSFQSYWKTEKKEKIHEEQAFHRQTETKPITRKRKEAEQQENAHSEGVHHHTPHPQGYTAPPYVEEYYRGKMNLPMYSHKQREKEIQAIHLDTKKHPRTIRVYVHQRMQPKE